VVTITKYDAVKGRIKGTFTADLMEVGKLTAANIKDGAFEVLRMPDEK